MELSIPKGALLFFDACTLIKMAADLGGVSQVLRLLTEAHQVLTSEGALLQYTPRGDEPSVVKLRDYLEKHGVKIVPNSDAFPQLAARDRVKPRRHYKATDVVLWHTFKVALALHAAQGVFVSDDGDFLGEESIRNLYGDKKDERLVVRTFQEVFGNAESRLDATFLRHWISIIEDSEILQAVGLQTDPLIRFQVTRIGRFTIKRLKFGKDEVCYRIIVGIDCRVTVPYKFPFEAPAMEAEWTTEREALIQYEVVREVRGGVPVGIGRQLPGSPRYLDPSTNSERKFA